MSTPNRFDAAIRRLAASLFSRLPDRTKRAVLFTSIVACRDRQPVNRATLHKLNTIMALCENDSALELPMKLSRVIWSGERGNVVMYSLDPENPISVEQTAEDLITLIPGWLKYGNPKGLREDLVKLLTLRQELAN